MEITGNNNVYAPSPEIMDKLSAFSTFKTFKEGAVIQQDNALIRAIPIVISGSIKVIRTDADGKEILLYYITEGESCIMSLLGGLHHENSLVKAIAEEETEILFVPVDKIMMMIKEYPGWVEYVFHLYHKRFEELLEVINEVAFKKMDERLLNLLNKKAELSHNRSLAITHEQLATELGTARVVVSRLLKQLEYDGRVKLGRNKISLV
jgi:CRP/FNR family transcriptional regulator